jgi:hypothetical protein
MSYFCPPCRRSIPDGQRCEHWSLDLALAAYSCPCGREGLSPGQDYHCLDCHQDFTRTVGDGAAVGDREAFYAHQCSPKRTSRKAVGAGRRA